MVIQGFKRIGVQRVSSDEDNGIFLAMTIYDCFDLKVTKIVDFFQGLDLEFIGAHISSVEVAIILRGKGGLDIQKNGLFGAKCYDTNR